MSSAIFNERPESTAGAGYLVRTAKADHFCHWPHYECSLLISPAQECDGPLRCRFSPIHSPPTDSTKKTTPTLTRRRAAVAETVRCTMQRASHLKADRDFDKSKWKAPANVSGCSGWSLPLTRSHAQRRKEKKSKRSLVCFLSLLISHPYVHPNNFIARFCHLERKKT